MNIFIYNKRDVLHKSFYNETDREEKLKLMKKCKLAICLLICTILTTGCGISVKQEKNYEPLVFGATYMTRNNPYFDVLNESIEEVVESNGDILLSRNPCQDQEKQNEQIQEMIDEGMKVLFLNPVDKDEVLPALKACKEAGVVIIDIDTMVQNIEYITASIETDNYQAGVLCAQDMMKRLDQAKIVVIDNPIQASISNRIQGFKDTIADHPEYEIVAETVGDGEIEVSATAMEAVIKENKEFNVVMGGNDPTALGALASLQQFHKEDGVLIYGVDGSPDFKSMLQLGYVTGTSIQSPKTIGRVAAEMAYQYLNGEEIETYTSIETELVTAENINDYEISGWQ